MSSSAGRVGADRFAVGGGHGAEPVEIAHRVHALVRRQVVGIRRAAPRCLAGMDLDELAPVEDPHQLAVGAHLDPSADERAGDRVERPGHLDVMIAMHLRGRVDRHVVDRRRRRQQPRRLLGGEHLGRSLLGRAMHPHPGPLPAPQLGAALRVGEIDEGLAGEERAAHELHLALDAGLVLRGPHPGRVDEKPAGLRVLDEALVQARLERVGAVDDRGHVVGDQRGEDPVEERPRCFAAGDHRLGGLAVREPHEAVPAEHRGEDQRVHDAVTPARRIEDQAHATEVDLQLVARLAIVDPHRRPPTPRAAQDLGHVALHRPARDLDPAARQQLADLHRGEIVLDPRCDLVVMRLTQPPRLTVAVEAMRAHRLDHQTDEPVGQLHVAAIADQTQPDRGIHVTADRLAVEADQPLRRSDALAGQPQPQHLSNLEHTDLPERHRRLRLAEQTTATRSSARPTTVDPKWSHHWRRGGPITGAGVVPCSWRSACSSGPMRLAGDRVLTRWPAAGVPSRRTSGNARSCRPGQDVQPIDFGSSHWTGR